MLRVIVRKTKEFDRRTIFDCPECGDRHAYFHSQPQECDKCDHSLPQIKLMIEHESYRVLYHFRKNTQFWVVL